ncbi:MAG: nucleoside recognition domain-containing protein [Prevotella sp.]|nr:nucleoside recognition domain-containing protein [Prevotella sp.]
MEKITIIKECFVTAVRPSLKMSWWLLKIMLPISLAVRLLQYYGVIEWCAQWLNPVFQYLGLPGASAIAFLTGASVTTYACLAVMMSMALTMRQATIIAIMVLICHALPLECAVVKKVGSKPFRMGLIRIAGAFMAALYLNMVLPEMNTPFGHVAASDVVITLGGVLQEWLISSVKLVIMIMGIIYSLTVVQRMMDDLGLMYQLVRPIQPLMRFFGLPRNAAYLWLVGNVLGISYGSAMMISLEESGQITKEEANEVNYHLIMNHSMLEDTMVFATAGVSAVWILSTRILFALLLVWGRKGIKRLTVKD